MRILMVSSYLPFPLHSGGQVRLYNLIKELSDKHEITLICEKRPHQTASDVKEVEKICKKVITVPRRKQWSIENVVRSATSGHSFLVTGHTHIEMQEAIIKELFKEHFDVIHVETYYVMQNIPLNPVPLVLVDHNIEYDVYKRFMDRAPLPVRPLLALDIKKIKKEEEKAWGDAANVIAVSEEDKKVIEKTGVMASLVPNGVNIDLFSFKTKKSSEEKKILFIGDFKWLQNKDSVTFIIKNIFPLIKEQTKNAKLWIVARNIPDSIRDLTTDPDVIFDEKSSAKPTPEIFQEADISLVPIRVGGGTSYKILESMSCGTPVVTMPMSASALHANDEEHLMVGKTAEELAKKTVALFENDNVYKEIAKNGRKLIEENYSWKEIAKELENIYNSIV
jgi:glycosyltransferase involved in cell wall biosynthesis